MVEITYDVGIESINKLLDYENFEAVDLSNGQLRDWQVTTSGSGMTFGLEQFEPNKNAFFADFDIAGLFQEVRITHKPINYYWPGERNTLKLSFDIYTRPLYTEVYISFDYALKFTTSTDTLYLQPTRYSDTIGRFFSTSTTDLIAGQFNRIFITDHLSWKTITVDIDLDPSLGTSDGVLDLYFNFNSNLTYDYASIAALKAVVTDNNPSLTLYNNKARVLFPNGPTIDSAIGYYELERKEGAVENSPDLILPNDYNTAFYRYVWVLKKQLHIQLTTREPARRLPCFRAH